MTSVYIPTPLKKKKVSYGELRDPFKVEMTSRIQPRHWDWLITCLITHVWSLLCDIGEPGSTYHRGTFLDNRSVGKKKQKKKTSTFRFRYRPGQMTRGISLSCRWARQILSRCTTKFPHMSLFTSLEQKKTCQNLTPWAKRAMDFHTTEHLLISCVNIITKIKYNKRIRKIWRWYIRLIRIYKKKKEKQKEGGSGSVAATRLHRSADLQDWPFISKLSNEFADVRDAWHRERGSSSSSSERTLLR